MKLVSPLVLATPAPSTVTISYLNKVYTAACRHLSWEPSGELHLAFVSTNKSRQLNKQFANNDYPTDVLSFNYTEYSQPCSDTTLPKQNVYGEIVICTDVAIQNAKTNKVDLRTEISLLLVHALIHLSGADHQTSKDKASFSDIQNGIIKSLNLEFHKMTW